MASISTIHHQNYTIDIDKQRKPLTGSLNGYSYTIDWQLVAPLASDRDEGGHYSLLIDGRSYDVFARGISQSGEQESRTYEIFLAGKRFEVTVEDEQTKMLTSLTRAGTSISNTASIQSPMPGLVVSVLCDLGASVQQGQTVIVLEAMKMENDLVSPISGIIKDIKVSPGQTVDQGALLVIIEKDG